ncbi:MAG: histone deacetylase family protein [Alphaproteobacteria bacterium]|nr:histone deacetylase family protein [Alphaproteobacteria bacterium]
MRTALFTHEACLDHNPGPSHPESPARLRAVLDALDEPIFSDLDRREAPRATIDQIARAHPRDYVTQLLSHIPDSGAARLDADTIVSPGSGEAALRAAGAACAAVDLVVSEEVRNAFCAVRPPGHHAEPTVPMGFCIFNNVAVGAAHAREIHGLNRVAVVDFDVHHGNGTQAIFQNNPDSFFASTHQSPLYPGTGAVSEKGCANNIVNAPLPPHAGSEEFQHAMTETILPALHEFAPDMVFISAGFDAHGDDPLASLNFADTDYSWATQRILEIAEECCNGRVVSTLEGGYDLAALGRSAALHIAALMTGNTKER